MNYSGLSIQDYSIKDESEDRFGHLDKLTYFKRTLDELTYDH